MTESWSLEKIDSIFPLSEIEVDGLHALGWESGFGYRTQPDWYWTPSAGPAIWLEDAADIGARWLVDLETIRYAEAERSGQPNGCSCHD